MITIYVLLTEIAAALVVLSFALVRLKKREGFLDGEIKNLKQDMKDEEYRTWKEFYELRRTVEAFAPERNLPKIGDRLYRYYHKFRSVLGYSVVAIGEEAVVCSLGTDEIPEREHELLYIVREKEIGKKYFLKPAEAYQAAMEERRSAEDA